MTHTPNGIESKSISKMPKKNRKKRIYNVFFSSFNIIIKTIMDGKLQQRTASNGNRKWREN